MSSVVFEANIIKNLHLHDEKEKERALSAMDWGRHNTNYFYTDYLCLGGGITFQKTERG